MLEIICCPSLEELILEGYDYNEIAPLFDIPTGWTPGFNLPNLRRLKLDRPANPLAFLKHISFPPLDSLSLRGQFGGSMLSRSVMDLASGMQFNRLELVISYYDFVQAPYFLRYSNLQVLHIYSMRGEQDYTIPIFDMYLPNLRSLSVSSADFEATLRIIKAVRWGDKFNTLELILAAYFSTDDSILESVREEIAPKLLKDVNTLVLHWSLRGRLSHVATAAVLCKNAKKLIFRDVSCEADDLKSISDLLDPGTEERIDYGSLPTLLYPQVEEVIVWVKAPGVRRGDDRSYMPITSIAPFYDLKSTIEKQLSVTIQNRQSAGAKSLSSFTVLLCHEGEVPGSIEYPQSHGCLLRFEVADRHPADLMQHAYI